VERRGNVFILFYLARKVLVSYVIYRTETDTGRLLLEQLSVWNKESKGTLQNNSVTSGQGVLKRRFSVQKSVCGDCIVKTQDSEN